MDRQKKCCWGIAGKCQAVETGCLCGGIDMQRKFDNSRFFTVETDGNGCSEFCQEKKDRQMFAERREKEH